MNKILVATVVGLVACMAQASEELQLFHANYEAYYQGAHLGNGVRKLERLPNGKYRMSSESKLRFLLISDTRYETTEFAYRGGQLQPVSYYFTRKGTGRDHRMLVNFSARQAWVNYDNKKKVIQVKEVLFDPLSYQIQLRLDVMQDKSTFTYPVVIKGNLRQLDFEVVGEELLKLPYGKVNTIKLKKVRKNSKRETYIWLAKELNYILVRLQQKENGKEEADLRLARVKFL
jgi:hypothetical protein